MWSSIESIEQVPDEIEVHVDYYRKTDYDYLEKALQVDEASKGEKASQKINLPTKDGQTLKISKTEFLAYWLFEDKDPTHPLARDFETLARDVAKAIPALSFHFESNGSSIRARFKKTNSERPPDIPTRLGVSVGLSIINKILGITRADWNKIDKSHNSKGKENPRFDYDLAATPSGFVAIENKGGIVQNNSMKKSVSERKREIIDGKKALRPSYGNVPLIGTIAVADSRDESSLKCWLLDPPIAPPDDLDPEVFQITSRLRYHRRLMKMVFPKWESLDQSIAERIESILLENQWKHFEKLALKRPNGARFQLRWNEVRKVQANSGDKLWVGVIGKLSPTYLLYFAMEHHWANAVVEQDLSSLLTMQNPSRTEEVMLQWQATNRECALLIGTKAEIGATHDGRSPVKLPATLYQTSSGFAFALIKKEIKQNKRNATRRQ